MSRKQPREIVGDLSASQGHNADRADGSDSTTGVMDAVQGLTTEDNSEETREPYPSTLTAGAHTRRLSPLMCPVEGCRYDHASSQGLVGHIPNASGSGHDWDAVGVSATDLHELASRGTHPKPSVVELLSGDGLDRQETKAATDVERVRVWCRQHVPVPLKRLQVYVYPALRRIEIAPREYLGGDEFDRFAETMRETAHIRFDGDRSVNVVNPENVNNLPIESGSERATGR